MVHTPLPVASKGTPKHVVVIVLLVVIEVLFQY